VQYRVDGFRFDIMSDIPLAALTRAKAAVDAAIGGTRHAYWYGEGWGNGTNRFVPAQQLSLAGSGIGAFNDRLRDAVRGGGPFDGGGSLASNHGLLQGACLDGSVAAATACDWIRVSMAGGVTGVSIGGVLSQDVDYNGQPAAFAADPQEVVNYAGVHDGATLYDITQYKLGAAVTRADRARAQVVALGTVLMSQGVPFIHAGDELLRSKGFDQNSYDSGDWFNRIDWTATTNDLDVMGLPPSADNGNNWNLIRATLEPTAGTLNANLVPGAADIAATRDAVLDLVRVRQSSTLFRLRTGADVRACVSFPDAAAPVAGVVAMRLGNDGTSCGDGVYANALVVVNGTSGPITVTVPGLAGHALALHPLQQAGSDPVVKTATASNGVFTVPARTVAVFVQ
jgi:pullulanase/glycogen debranching enzyme